MSKPSDGSSSKLILQNLMNVESGLKESEEVEARILYYASNHIKDKKSICKSSFLKMMFMIVVGVFCVATTHVIGYAIVCVAAAAYFFFDYRHNKMNNKHLEKMLSLSADLQEKRLILDQTNEHLIKQNKELTDKVNIINQIESIKEEKHRVQSNLANITSYNNHLTNIIRGVNHEVSPWLGSISNILSLAKDELTTNHDKLTDSDMEILKYIDEARKASKQAADVLVLTSKNVKKLRNWSTTNSNLSDTVRSWCYIALMEHDIKGRLNESNLKIDYASLNFDVLHSPMLVSQIILNLVKNALDHNEDRLDDLIIKIYGDGKRTLFVEDNGKGIDTSIINDIFKPGVSTKGDSALPSGLGLASTVDYCMLMGSIIRVESKVGAYTRFHIAFKKDATDSAHRKDGTDEIGRRSAYYEVIKNSSNAPVIPQKPHSNSVEITPVQDTHFRMRMVEIDETLKSLK